jgi:hypothetical protein
MSILDYEEKSPYHEGVKRVELYGKRITAAKFDETELRLIFDDGTVISLSDDADHCCERRYLTCDDDVQSLVGNVLIRIEDREGDGGDEDGWSQHDTRFVEVATDQNFITLTTHNIHNGYYSGFKLTIKRIT